MKDGNAVSSTFLSWIHFGDLHIQDAQDDNYLDLLDLIDHANEYLVEEVISHSFPGTTPRMGQNPSTS